MKIAKLPLTCPAGGDLLRLAGYVAAGFFASGCCLEGRAPLAAGFLAACGPGRNAIAALAGAGLGCFLFLPFGPALRACGILVLIYAVLAAFQGTKWAALSWFRPAAAGGAALAVELAYALQMGLDGPGFLRLAASTALSAALCHYCALLLRETSLPRRKAPREPDNLRQRLRLSAQALRSLGESFGAAPQPQKEENPAVIFDRAAEVVCRGCALRDLCWNKEYLTTFNAFNDATPAMLERGRAEPSDFSVHFGSRCIHFPQLISAINTEVTALLLRRQYRRQLDRERERTRGQYVQLGELVAQAMTAAEAPAATGKELCHEVAMGSEPKEGQRLCGDSVTWFRTGPMLYMILSDGMGSGREAQRESQMTLRLLEQFLQAGIEAEPALRTLNAALNLRGDEQGSFTTIDLLAADLNTRQATLYKYGAAPTYIKRHGAVRRLTGSALPAGLQDGGPQAIQFPLEENTFLLMISDGVADTGEDAWVQDLLAGWQGEDPNVLASLVLREAYQRRKGDDDRSVLCLYLPVQSKGKREV
ncbi:MAG: SpoIIE family protein phosphatase [Oscillospiraceae bacterium]|nr:SpoIIE family protein phosphatase [Oscillospiraceae bacterium]